MQSDHSTQLLHWLNQPPSFALGGKGSPRSQSVIPAHRVHPSSRLPLDVQHLLEFLPPSWLLGLLLLWFLHIECILPPGCPWMCSTSWNSSLLAPRSPTPALVPGHNLFSRGSPVGPISCPGPGSFGPSCSYIDPCLLSLLVLLVLLAATAVGVATTPVGAPHGPLLLLLSPGPVCARTPRSSSLPLLLIRHLLL